MKKEYLILAVIIVALAAYLVLHKTDSTHYTLPVLDDMSETSIDHIDISQGEKTIAIKNDGGSWTVGENNLPANEATIKTMVESIENLALTALVSESKSYTRYELDDTSKISITAKQAGKVLRIFHVGKVAASFRHTFVTLENDTNVYHANGNLKRAFDKTIDDLADKLIMKIDRSKVYGIQSQEADKSLELTKKQKPVSVDVAAEDKTEDTPPTSPEKEIWVDASGAEKGNAKINAFISEFTNLTCKAYVTEMAKADYKDSILSVTINSDKPYTLSIFPKKDGEENYPAISSERDFPFTLPASKVDSMKKKLGEI